MPKFELLCAACSWTSEPVDFDDLPEHQTYCPMCDAETQFDLDNPVVED